MKAKSIKGKSTEEIKAGFEKAIEDGFKPTLAVVFLSKKQDQVSLRNLLTNAGIAIFGATTNGEFIDEETTNGAVSILLMDINPAYFTIMFDEYPDKNYREKANTIATKALHHFTNPAFLVSYSHLETDAEAILLGFEDIVGAGAGRQVALGPMIQQEVEGLKNIWNVPMAGMFSNAELGKSNGGNLEMHNLTTCMVALKEK